MSYELKTEKFSGPIEKLLELTQARQMDITQVALSDVTADFLEYLNKLKAQEGRAAPNRLIADFVLIASKLLLLKSKVLLPDLLITAEEESDIRDLETRVKLYKEIKEASRLIEKVWNGSGRSFSRELYLNKPPVFYPPKDLDQKVLVAILERLTLTLKKEIAEEEMPKAKMISITEKVKELLERMTGNEELSLHGMTKEKERGEIIAVFLAILHLIRDHLVDFEQAEPHGDVIIKKK